MGQHLTYCQRAEGYARAVVDGEVVAGKWTRAACQRQLDDLVRWQDPDDDWPYYFVADAAERVCRFLELLPHVKGPKAGSLLELEDWQVFSLVCVYGWYRAVDHTRRFRTVYEEVARKNAKTTKLSGLSLYHLACDGEAGAEIYSAATTREQSKIVHDIARRMAAATPEYRLRFGVEVLRHSVVQENTGSVFVPLSAEGSTLDGLNPSFATIDELHAHKTRDVHDVLDSGTGARAQPLLWKITTAGSNRAGICYEQRGYLCDVLNTTLHKHDGLGYRIEGRQSVDESLFGIIYSIDADDDPLDEACWPKANPNLGVSVSVEDMRRMATHAKATPAAMNNFLTKRLNVWVNAESAWMDMREWDGCGDPGLDEAQFEHEACWQGLDAAFKTDVFARARVYRRGGDYYAFLSYYMPEAQIEAEGHDHFAGWHRAGLITQSPGPVIDVELVREDLVADASRVQIREIGYDPFQLQQFASEMLEDGFPMVEVRPTVLNFSEPMKELEVLVKSGRFHHNGDPVLSWMVANVVCHRDQKDNIYPRKEKPDRKIDGVIAVLMALSRAMAGEGGDGSIYDRRDLLVV